VNGLAERHQLTMQDVALPSLADSADERHGLKPLGDRFAGYALVYATDLHNAMPASGGTVGRTPCEGLLGRQAALGAFRRFGYRFWVHTPGKPFIPRRKFDLRARPGRFLRFDQPFRSGIFKELLDGGEVMQSQTVIFYGAPHVPPPVLLPDVAAQQQLRWSGDQGVGDMDGDSDNKDEVQVQTIVPPVQPVAPFARASDEGSDSADEVELHRYPTVLAVPEVAPAVPPAAPPTRLTGSGKACASFAESTFEVRKCSYERASTRGWGHLRRAYVPLEGPRAKAGLSVHGTKPAGQRHSAWPGGQCKNKDPRCKGTSMAANAA
jgi:hypothetical protein